MSADESKDAAAKARIISHMNKDHQKEMVNYLRHYASLSPTQASSPELIDITLSHMILTTAWGASVTPPSAYKIPIEPPMSSYADARLRAVSMNETAMAGLGISDVTITRFVPLRPAHAITSAVFALGYLGVVAYHAGYVERGSAVRGLVESYFPGGPRVYEFLMTKAIPAIFVIHLGEAVLMARKLAVYGVEAGSGIWWKWCGSTIFEGFTAFQRLSREVKKLKEVKGTKEH